VSDTLLPPNASSEEVALDLSVARVGDVPTPVRSMWNADTCAADLLPWLAWAFSVDEWNVNWTEAQKRAVVKSSYEVHRRKGTIGAVRRALESLGLTIDVVEWFQEEPPGDPYTFRVAVTADQSGADQAGLEKAIALVMANKNLRSHLASIDLLVNTAGGIFFAGVAMIGNEITVGPQTPSEAGFLTEGGSGILTEDDAQLITE
jgi:phage tail P2-like protein